MLEHCLLCYQASALRILERLHLGKSSRENKLQIPSSYGKRLMFKKAALGTLAETSSGLALAFSGSDMEPSGAHGCYMASQGDFLLRSWNDSSFTGVIIFRSPGKQQLLWFQRFLP